MLLQPIKPPAPARLGFVPPLLPTLVDTPPAGDAWLHEIKHDGYRTQLLIADGGARLFTRNGHDWTDKYRPIAAAAHSLGCRDALIDGEMIVQDEYGRSDYDAFRAALSRDPGALVFYAFDLLATGGEDIRRCPIEERRNRLCSLIGEHDPAFPIQFSEALAGDARQMLVAACEMGLEGIVSKRLGSRYVSGRSTAWLKTKCYDEGEFVVLGAEHEPGKPAFALLARETDGALEYAGSAFVTLGGAERDHFWNEIERLGTSAPAIAMERKKARRWAKPELRARVQHLKGGGMLRHATVREIVA